MPGTFVFKPIEATLDYKADIGLHPENLDPYCKVKVGHIALSTHPSKNLGIHPHWDDNLVVQQGEDTFCTISVKDRNKGTLGEVKLDLDEIEAKGKVTQWFDISKDRKKQGQLMMEVVYTSGNPQSRSWLLSSREGAALAGDSVRVREHASTAEIGPFRVFERLRTPSQRCSHTSHMTSQELAEARKHVGNNIVARYAVDHMNPQDHTAIKHEIAYHNAKVLNSSHTQDSHVVVRDEPPLSKRGYTTNKDKADASQHLGARNVKSRPSTGVKTTPFNYANAKDAADIARNLGNKGAYDDGYVRMKGVPVSGNSQVYHMVPQETVEARQHVPNPRMKDNQAKIMNPVTAKDAADIAQHVGNLSPSGQDGAVIAGHTDDYYVRAQREPLAGPLVDDYTYNEPGSQPGNAHSGHSGLQNAQPRVQRDDTVVVTSPGYVAPVIGEYRNVYNTPGSQSGNAHAGHSGLQNAQPRVQRDDTAVVTSPGYVAPMERHIDGYNVPGSRPGYAHAGHSSLQHARARVVRDEAGPNWVHNVVERESVASSCHSCGSYASCTSCVSAFEGMSNPNNAGKSLEYLKGLERVNRLNEQERALTCDSCSVRSDLSEKRKRDYWYLDSIGMSDPNTAKLGVNHSPSRCGLIEPHHSHHHHHHHHGHHHGHSHHMKDRVVYAKPTLADINTIGGAVVYKKH